MVALVDLAVIGGLPGSQRPHVDPVPDGIDRLGRRIVLEADIGLQQFVAAGGEEQDQGDDDQDKGILFHVHPPWPGPVPANQRPPCPGQGTAGRENPEASTRELYDPVSMKVNIFSRVFNQSWRVFDKRYSRLQRARLPCVHRGVRPWDPPGVRA